MLEYLLGSLVVLLLAFTFNRMVDDRLDKIPTEIAFIISFTGWFGVIIVCTFIATH